MWPDKKILLNFPSSVHLADENTVYRHAEQILAGAGNSGRLQIQISENVPPDAWRRGYPQIGKAIEAFGRPRFEWFRRRADRTEA